LTHANIKISNYIFNITLLTFTFRRNTGQQLVNTHATQEWHKNSGPQTVKAIQKGNISYQMIVLLPWQENTLEKLLLTSPSINCGC